MVPPRSKFWGFILVFISFGSDHGGVSGLPVAQISNIANSLDFSQVPNSRLIETTVTSTVTPDSSSDRIPRGTRANWRLGIFFSADRQGSGSRANQVGQLLPRDQQRLPMYPGRDIIFEATNQLNLNGVGTGTNYPYLCIEFTKDENNRDFEFPQRSIISCNQFTSPAVSGGGHGGGGGGGRDLPVAQVSNIANSLDFTTDPDSQLVETTVTSTVTADSSSDSIRDSGRAKWRLGIFFSRNQQGTGTRANDAPQLLSGTQQQKPMYPGRDTIFEGSKKLNFNGVGSGTNYPYLCIEFNKDDNNEEFEFPQGPIISCQEFTPPSSGGGHGGGGHGGGGGGRDLPVAQVSNIANALDFTTDPDSHLVDTTVTSTVTVDSNSDRILDSGRAKWRLGIFFSRNDQGTGTRANDAPQLLQRTQQQKPMYPGRDTIFEGSKKLNFNGVGSGTNYPYLCIEFNKDDNNQEFEFPQGPIISCQEFTPPSSGGGHGGGGHGGGGGGRDLPVAQVSNIANSLDFTTDPDSHSVETTVTSTVTADSSSDRIRDSGRANWRLGIFFSRNQQGTGTRANEVRQLLSRTQQQKSMYPGRDVIFEGTEELNFNGVGTGTNYPYLCIEFNKDESNQEFEFPQGAIISCNEFTPPSSGGGGLPVAQVSNVANSLDFTTDDGSRLVETTVTSTVTADSSSDRIPDSGRANWRLGIFFSRNGQGTGTRANEVRQLLSRAQQRKPMYPGRDTIFEGTSQINFNGVGTGTNYPYLCVEFTKDESNQEFQFPQGSIISCNEFTAPSGGGHGGGGGGGGHGGGGGGTTSDDQVMATEVIPEKKLKAFQKTTTPLTFDVMVKVDPSSDQVQGSNLWNLRVWASKLKTGRGARHGEVSQALSQQQQRQTIQNGRKIPFRDVSITMDLSDVKCVDVKFICAEISQGSNRDFTLAAPVIGCEKMRCKKKPKKQKPPKPSGPRQPTLAIRSIEPSRVSIFDEREYQVRFTTEIEFDASQSQPLTEGVKFWKLSAWFNDQPDGSNKYAKVDQLLNNNKRDKYVRDVSETFRFAEIEFTANLRDLECRQLRYFCIKLAQDDPTVPFNFVKAVDNANVGCSRTTCR